MRILLITNMYPPHHLGGYELSCHDVVDRLLARGHGVTVLTTSFERAGVAPRADSPHDVRRTLDLYWRDDHPWTPSLREMVALERHDHRELRRALRELDPDVVSVWNMGALPLSLISTLVRSRRPIVHHTCNDWPALNLQLDPFRRFADRHPLVAGVVGRALGLPTDLADLGRSGRFCWVSQATWDAAERSTPWTFPDSIVVHSGISHTDFPPLDPPHEARPWRGKLLFVGRIEGMKSVETAVAALALLPDTTLDLVGPADPDYLNGLVAQATALGVDDRLRVSEVTRGELRSRYLDADAVLFTSRDEPFGLVPIEAMACATPVVASGAGGSREFLADGTNCLLYEPLDAASLAAAVERLASDATLRLALARAGLATAAEFSVDRLTDRLEAAHLASARS